MNVIGHQAVGKAFEIITVSIFFYQRKITIPVTVVQEEGLAVIASGADMKMCEGV